MFVRMALMGCLLAAVPAADALASGFGGGLGLRGRRSVRRDVVVQKVVVQPAYVQQAVVVQKVRQQRVKVVQPVYGSYSSFQSVYAAPQVYAAPVYAAPVYVPPVQYAAPVQQQQYASQSGSLDLQLGDLTRLLQKLSCVAECFATP